MSSQIQTPSLAVVLHLSNLAMWPNYLAVLKQLPTSTSFFVTTSLGLQESVKKLVQQDLKDAQFYAFESKGRDFGPLISLLKLVPLYKFDLVLKLHTGNTDFYSEIPNEKWLMQLICRLVPQGKLNLIFNHFKNDTSLGLIGPRENHWPLKKLFFNENTATHWNKLIEIRNLPFYPEEPYFFAGGMFWARGSIFKGYADLALNQNQFEVDSLDIDGTLSHALERYVCLIAHDQNLKIESVDFSDFSHWLSERFISDFQSKQFKEYIALGDYIPKLQIIVRREFGNSDFELNLSLQSIALATQCGVPVNTQTWQESDSIPLNRFAISLAKANSDDWLLIIKAGDELTPFGLLMAYIEMIKQPDLNAIYTDKMLRAPGGSIETAFLPDFNHDLLISFPWLMSNHWFFKLDLLIADNGFDDSVGQFFELALILELLATQDHPNIWHLAEPLLITPEPKVWGEESQERHLVEKYLVRSGYPNARVLQLSPRLYRALYLQETSPLISIVIPIHDYLVTQRCLESLLQNTSYIDYEILLVANHSTDSATKVWLQSIRDIDPQKFRTVFCDGPSNHYTMSNAGGRSANGELLVFVDSSIQFIEPSWLDALVIHGQRQDVGAVGVKLVDAELNILNAGYVLGMKPGNENAFKGERFDNIGYLQRLSLDQEYSAVSGLCLMVRTTVFATVNGFNTTLDTKAETDIDFCLKLKTQGLRNIWTPHAVVQWDPKISAHQSSTSNGSSPSCTFLNTWLPLIANDPFYNKNLSLLEKPYDVESLQELNWRPLTWRPNPVILAHPSDETGCGQYRIIKPLLAMREEGIADGIISHRPLIYSELERLQPDIVVFQRPLSREFLDYMKHSKTYSDAFKVYEIDDLITNIPLKSNSKSSHSKDTVKLLREGIAQVDRLVVSTNGLAEAYSNWHKEIKVLELKLPTSWWGDLEVTRTEHKKPRVGWAGGSSHLGDLELISDVVKALANEVDWVFLGMCPKKLRPYIKEFHNGVPIHLYPQKLASLDLDLAIAPLEKNPFNECKSNLRLLEYGACAYPVICSDTRAFIDSKLPVHIVKNKFKDWTSAIRAHIYDLDACRIKGRELANLVNNNWLLNSSTLNTWKATWSE